MRIPSLVRSLACSLALVVALAACGGSDASSSSDAPAAVTTAGEAAAAPTDADADDVEFAQAMIAHHEQAIEMAELALDPKAGAGAAVQDLATRIKRAQDPEIAQMEAWLTAEGQPLQMDTSDGHDMASMDGMMSAEDMDALAAATGTAFDAAWLPMMIEHHEGAVRMSEKVIAEGTDAELRTLAEGIIAAQQAEIAEMKALVGG
jgi:uncharacterized protein (DUF305 family)